MGEVMEDLVVLESKATAPKEVPTVDLFDLRVKAATMEDVLDRVDCAIATRSQLNIGVINAAKIVNMRKDSELRDAVLSSDAIYADGMSVVWASRVLGQPLPERIAGIDLMYEIMNRGQEKAYRVFCLGARQEVLDKVNVEFGRLYPGTIIAGSRHGYFDLEDEEEIANMVRDARPDVLFVAISSPKKERFMAKWTNVMDVPVVHGVGGSFDVVAGLVARAPEIWQRLGLEWLYRLKQEPGRLWKRYFTTNSQFIWLVCKERLLPTRTCDRQS